jgi:vacuolar-type H+-ATPase subunit I/STV1
MTTAGSIEVDSDTDEVTIHEVTIRDAELASYLADHGPNERREIVDRAFRVGLMTLQLADTSKDLEYVKREFETMQTALENELTDVREDLDNRFGNEGDLPELLDDYFGEDGELREALTDAFGEDGELTDRLDEQLGEDGERLQAALDPDADGTPTNRLKSQLIERIDSLRDKLAEEAGAQEERQLSPRKGEDFEDTVAEMLDDIVYRTNDSVRHTGTEEGDIGEKVGDHVLTLGETGQRIVIESKSEADYSEPKIRDQLDRALENRSADVAIFVSKCESYLPNKLGYFQEFDKQRLSVCLSEDDDDDLDRGFLQIGLNWARMRAIEEHVDTGTRLDSEAVQAQVENVRQRVEQVSEVKKKCSSITDTAEQIKSELDELRDDVTDDLNQITAELSKERSD